LLRDSVSSLPNLPKTLADVAVVAEHDIGPLVVSISTGNIPVVSESSTAIGRNILKIRHTLIELMESVELPYLALQLGELANVEPLVFRFSKEAVAKHFIALMYLDVLDLL